MEEQNSETGARARAGKELRGVGLYHSPLRQIRMKFCYHGRYWTTLGKEDKGNSAPEWKSKNK